MITQLDLPTGATIALTGFVVTGWLGLLTRATLRYVLRRNKHTTRLWENRIMAWVLAAYAALLFCCAVYTPGGWALALGFGGLLITGLSSSFWSLRNDPEPPSPDTDRETP